MWDTRMGTIELAIPKVTPCTYVPSLLQPRRRAEHACAVVQEAYVHGVSTRKVDDLVKALGVAGISTSEVSRICGELDTVVSAFRTRPLTGQHRYLWVDATYHKVRVAGRVISHATVPGAFHAESISHGAARGAGGDRGRRPHDLCAAGPRLGMTQLRKVADDLIQRIRSPTRPVRFNLNQKLAEWENFYNYQRPQGAFEEKTPYEALREKLG